MNLHQASGIKNLVVGIILEGVGRLIANNHLQQSGFALQVRGRSQSAIGDAQNIIKGCVKRNGLVS